MPDFKALFTDPATRALLARSVYRLIVLVVGALMAKGKIAIAPDDWSIAQEVLGAALMGGAIVVPSRSTPAIEAVVATQVKTTALTPEAQAVEKATVPAPPK